MKIFSACVILCFFFSLNLPLGAAEPSYEFGFLQESLVLKQGEQATYELAIEMKEEGAYIHPKAPFKIEVKCPKLSFDQKIFEQKDAKKRQPENKARELVFEGTFEGTNSGQAELKASLEFFFCTAKICEKRVSDATLKVLVKD